MLYKYLRLLVAFAKLFHLSLSRESSNLVDSFTALISFFTLSNYCCRGLPRGRLSDKFVIIIILINPPSAHQTCPASCSLLAYEIFLTFGLNLFILLSLSSVRVVAFIIGP